MAHERTRFGEGGGGRHVVTGGGRRRKQGLLVAHDEPGVDVAGAWAEIDFNTPLATRLAKDWSYLGIG